MSDFLFSRCGHLKVFVDGSYRESRRYCYAGIGIWFNYGHDWNHSESIYADDNNEAEYEAALQAVEIVEEYTDYAVMIFTDSEFVMRHRQSLRDGPAGAVFMYVPSNCRGLHEAHKLARRAIPF